MRRGQDQSPVISNAESNQKYLRRKIVQDTDSAAKQTFFSSSGAQKRNKLHGNSNVKINFNLTKSGFDSSLNALKKSSDNSKPNSAQKYSVWQSTNTLQNSQVI